MKQQSNPSTEGLNSDKPRWDNWHVRLPNPKDQQKIIDLFQRSGAKTKSDFVRARLLGEEFKVISVDKSAVEYNRKLSEFTAQIHKIGILYNQAVRALNTYHSVKTAQVMLDWHTIPRKSLRCNPKLLPSPLTTANDDCQNFCHGKPRWCARLQL